MKRREFDTYGSAQSANIIAIVGILLYTAGRNLEVLLGMSDYSMRKSQTLWLFSLSLLVILIILMRFSGRGNEHTLAVLVPMLTYAFLLAGAITTEDFEFFFLVHLVVFGICCLYQNFLASLTYLILTNVVHLLLFVFYFPSLAEPFRRVAYSSTRDFPSGILIIDWFVALIASLALLTVTKVATRKSGEAYRSLMAFETLLASTPNYVLLIDGMKRVMYISKPLTQLAKQGGAEFTQGRPLLDIFEDAELKAVFSDIIDTDNLLEDTREIYIDGQQKYFKIIASKLTGVNTGMLIDITDITPVILSKLEADDARLAAEQANRAKSDFLARMSHEIRTPMNAIIGMGDLIRTDNLDKTQTGYFNDIRRSSKALMQIINDILDFSKIEADKLDIIPVDFNLRALYENMCSLNVYTAGVKNLDFQAEIADDVPEVVLGDEVRVRQILTNLLSNAIKYTRTGYVAFNVKKAERYGEDYIGFTIEDSGIGVREEDIPKLFISFEQIDQINNRGIMGTGLGLPIVKRLTDLMGGKITVDSVYGVGSRFSVYLPLPPGDSKKIENSQPLRHVIAKPGTTVLVVDDNQTNLTVARAFLATHEILTETATSGYEAVDKIGKNDYDIVFMDHMMPDINGIEATRLIRGIDTLRCQSLPIIALTANVVIGEQKAFITAGMSDFIPKPILAENMNRILQKWLPADHILRYDEIRREEDEAAEIAAPDAIIVNINKGLLHSIGNEQLYRQLLNDFTRNYRDAYKQIADGMANGDFALSYRLVHTLKNAARMIGAELLGDAAQVVESGLSKGDATFMDGQLSSLQQALHATLAEVGKLNASGGGANGLGAEYAPGGAAAGMGAAAGAETGAEAGAACGGANAKTKAAGGVGANAGTGARADARGGAGGPDRQRPGAFAAQAAQAAQVAEAGAGTRKRATAAEQAPPGGVEEDGDRGAGPARKQAANTGIFQISDVSIRRARDILSKITPLVKSHRASALDYVEIIESELAPFGEIAANLAKNIDNYDYKNALEMIDALEALLIEVEGGKGA